MTTDIWVQYIKPTVHVFCSFWSQRVIKTKLIPQCFSYLITFINVSPIVFSARLLPSVWLHNTSLPTLGVFFSFLPWRWAISQGTMCYLKHFSETREQFVFKEEKKGKKKKEKRQLWENVLRQADYKSVQMGPYGWTNKQASLLAGKREWVRSASHIVFIKYVYKYGGLSFVLGRGSDVCCVHIRVLTFHYAV